MTPATVIIKELKTFVGTFDNNKQAAKALKVTPSVLSLTINGKINVIPERILAKLGYRSELVYIAKVKKPKPTPAPVVAVAPAAPKPVAATPGSNPPPPATPKPAPPANPPAAPAVVENVVNVFAKDGT